MNQSDETLPPFGYCLRPRAWRSKRLRPQDRAVMLNDAHEDTLLGFGQAYLDGDASLSSPEFRTQFEFQHLMCRALLVAEEIALGESRY